MWYLPFLYKCVYNLSVMNANAVNKNFIKIGDNK